MCAPTRAVAGSFSPNQVVWFPSASAVAAPSAATGPRVGAPRAHAPPQHTPALQRPRPHRSCPPGRPARYSYLLTRLCHAPAADPAPVHRNQPHDPPTGRRRGGGRSRASHSLAVPYQIRRRFVTNHRARTPSPTALLTRSSRRQVGDGAGGGDRLTCARRCAGRTNQEKGLLRCYLLVFAKLLVRPRSRPLAQD